MYRVLMPVDDSEDRARRQARTVATLPLEPDSVTVTLTHVIHGAEKEAPEAMQNPQRVASVRRAREILEEANVAVEIREASAPPAEGILDLAASADADHIVLGGRKRSPAGKAIFGSVTQSVVLETDLPVTITG